MGRTPKKEKRVHKLQASWSIECCDTRQIGKAEYLALRYSETGNLSLAHVCVPGLCPEAISLPLGFRVKCLAVGLGKLNRTLSKKGGLRPDPYAFLSCLIG